MDSSFFFFFSFFFCCLLLSSIWFSFCVLGVRGCLYVSVYQFEPVLGGGMLYWLLEVT